MRQLILGRAADRRLGIARDFLASATGEIVVIGASRGAADDFARSIAEAKPTTFGLHRFSLPQLASRIARLDAARDGVSPAASLMIDALMAHAAHERSSAGALAYFGPVAHLPGFPRALRSTLSELRQADVSSASLDGAPSVGRDLATLLEGYVEALDAFGISDVADLYERATRVMDEGPPSFVRQTVVLLDLPVRSVRVERFISTLLRSASRLVITEPTDDVEACAFFAAAGCEVSDERVTATTALERVRDHLFALEVPVGLPDDTVQLFSAPGEGREAVEIARAVLREARRGVPFDEMAVLLRNPAHYIPHIAGAFRRAAIPVYFAHGARRSDPAGRAFLALLACGAENLSARRFAEYLSLGQVPLEEESKAAPAPPEDDALIAVLGLPAEDANEPDTDEAPLREPWKWEEIIIEAAVLGGADRWERRLSGLEREYAARLRSLETEDPTAPQAEALRRDIKRLAELRSFAIPVITALQELNNAATWQAWLDRLDRLARQTLKSPRRVLRALADLRPMGHVGPVAYADVIMVLTDRLTTLERPQPSHRYGHVLIAPLEYARGRTFRTVFVPGVAERAFPQRPREDPLLLDRVRAYLPERMIRQEDRSRHERLLLQLAAGAASERLILSYSRMDVREARPRVSSFYALDVVRAASGGIPDYEAVEARAWAAAGATMAWPAPASAADAIDALEYDLATLRPLLLHPDPAVVRGRANYLVQLHPMVGRALRTRRARWAEGWGAGDGFLDVSDTVRATLTNLSLRSRPYSPSGLQHFAACPYRFYLSAILRLRTREEPERIEVLDPLTRGTLVHEIYAAVLRQLQADRLLPIGPKRLHEARSVADRVLSNVATRAHDDLAPAIELVWDTAIAAIRTDMQIWLGQLADISDEWLPTYFELGFGVQDRADLDPASSVEPVVIAEGFQLRGSIDLVEQSLHTAQIRVRDYKIGQDSTKKTLVVGNGEVLQPTLYALAAERALGLPAVEGQLWYASARGGFRQRTVPLTTSSRNDALAVLTTIDDAILSGSLPAAPRRDACTHCDFLRVCGPYEEIRIGRKADQPLGPLSRIRRLP